MKFKFCDLAHYSAMNLEGFLDRHDIKYIKDETSYDKIERTYDITIMSDDLFTHAHGDHVRIGLMLDGIPIYRTKIHITDFSELKIF